MLSIKPPVSLPVFSAPDSLSLFLYAQALIGSYRYHDASFMGRCTPGLVFGSILMCIVALDQLFRNTFHLYRYNLLLCLLEPVIECSVWNIVADESLFR